MQYMLLITIFFGSCVGAGLLVRVAHKRALQCSKRRATPATWADVQHIITNFDTEASLLIPPAYCCCSRIGDVARLLLKKKDLS